MDLHEIRNIRQSSFKECKTPKGAGGSGSAAGAGKGSTSGSLNRAGSAGSAGGRQQPIATCACVCGQNLAVAMFDGLGSWIIARNSRGKERKVGWVHGGSAAIRTMRWTEGFGFGGVRRVGGWSAATPSVYSGTAGGQGKIKELDLRLVNRDQGIGVGRQGKLLVVMGPATAYVVSEEAMYSEGQVLRDLLWTGMFEESGVAGAEWWRWWQGGVDLACIALEDASVVLVDPARGRLCTVRCDITRGVTGLIKVDDEPSLKERMAMARARGREGAGGWEARGVWVQSVEMRDWWEQDGGGASEQALILTTAEEGCFALLLDLSRLLAWSSAGSAVECIAVNLPQASPNAPALLRPLPSADVPTVTAHDASDDTMGVPLIAVQDTSRGELVLQEGRRLARACDAGWYDAMVTGQVIKRGFGWPHRWTERTMVLKESGQVDYYTTRNSYVRSDMRDTFHLSKFCCLREIKMHGVQHAFALMTLDAAAAHDAGDTVIRVACRGGKDAARAVYLCCKDEDKKRRWLRAFAGVLGRMEAGRKEGVLRKRGDAWPHVWRDRPLQLLGSGYLRYFKDEEAKSRQEERGCGRITRLSSAVRLSEAESEGNQHAFKLTDVVQPNGASVDWSFAASSAEDLDAWLRRLSAVITLISFGDNMSSSTPSNAAPSAPSSRRSRQSKSPQRREESLQTSHSRTSSQSPTRTRRLSPETLSRSGSPAGRVSGAGGESRRMKLRRAIRMDGKRDAGRAWRCEMPQSGPARILCVWGKRVYFLVEDHKQKDCIGERILVVSRSTPPVILQKLRLDAGERAVCLIPMKEGGRGGEEEFGDGGLVLVCKSGALYALKKTQNPLELFTAYLSKYGDLETGEPHKPEDDKVAGLHPASVPKLQPLDSMTPPSDTWDALPVSDTLIDGRTLSLEQLCVASLGLPLSGLHEHAAHLALAQARPKRAADLLHLSGVSPLVAVEALLGSKETEEAGAFLAKWLARRKVGNERQWRIVQGMCSGAGLLQTGVRIKSRPVQETWQVREWVEGLRRSQEDARLLMLLQDLGRYDAAAELFKIHGDMKGALQCSLLHIQRLEVPQDEASINNERIALYAEIRSHVLQMSAVKHQEGTQVEGRDAEQDVCEESWDCQGEDAASSLCTIARTWIGRGLRGDVLEEWLLQDADALLGRFGLLPALLWRYRATNRSTSDKGRTGDSQFGNSNKSLVTDDEDEPATTPCSTSGDARGMWDEDDMLQMTGAQGVAMRRSQGFPLSEEFLVKMIVTHAARLEQALGREDVRDRIVSNLHYERAQKESLSLRESEESASATSMPRT